MCIWKKHLSLALSGLILTATLTAGSFAAFGNSSGDGIAQAAVARYERRGTTASLTPAERYRDFYEGYMREKNLKQYSIYGGNTTGKLAFRVKANAKGSKSAFLIIRGSAWAPLRIKTNHKCFSPVMYTGDAEKELVPISPSYDDYYLVMEPNPNRTPMLIFELAPGSTETARGNTWATFTIEGGVLSEYKRGINFTDIYFCSPVDGGFSLDAVNESKSETISWEEHVWKDGKQIK